MILDGHSVNNFKDPLEYALSQEKQPQIIGGRCLGNTATEIAEEFREVAKKGRSQKPCKHFYLSFAPEDTELSVIDKAEIVDEIVKRLGYVNNQYVTIEHGRDDPSHPKSHNHDHLHIIVNAVDEDTGFKVNDSYEIKRGIKICRDLEKEWGLTQVDTRFPFPEDRIPKQHQERIKRERNPKPYYKGQMQFDLQSIIDTAIQKQPTITDFFRELKLKGVGVNAKLTQKGEVGLTYSLPNPEGDRYYWRSSSLDRATASQLRERGVRGLTSNPNQDVDLIKSAIDGNTSIKTTEQHQPDFFSNNIEKIISEHCRNQTSLAQFFLNLAEDGVIPKLRQGKNGRKRIYYVNANQNDQPIRGSNLAHGSYAKLLKHGLEDDLEDNPSILEAAIRGDFSELLKQQQSNHQSINHYDLQDENDLEDQLSNLDIAIKDKNSENQKQQLNQADPQQITKLLLHFLDAHETNDFTIYYTDEQQTIQYKDGDLTYSGKSKIYFQATKTPHQWETKVNNLSQQDEKNLASEFKEISKMANNQKQLKPKYQKQLEL